MNLDADIIEPEIKKRLKKHKNNKDNEEDNDDSENKIEEIDLTKVPSLE
jgi:hypothetical protein